ncbi:MAG: ribonuclease P protein component [Marinoscillum sp.]
MTESGHSYRFPKKERLTGKKDIEELFKNGSSFYLHPLLVKYIVDSDAEYHSVLFTVSKKHFKKAVDRNLIKRRMREAYRLQKQILEGQERFYKLAFVYIDKTIVPYSLIEPKLKKLLDRLKNQSSNRGKEIKATDKNK